MKYSIALAAVAGALCLVPAQAHESHRGQTDVYSRVVIYDDLDLRSEEGQAALHNRLRTAVHDVCGGASESDLAASNRVRTCRKTLMRRAAEVSGDVTAAATRPAMSLATASAR